MQDGCRARHESRYRLVADTAATLKEGLLPASRRAGDHVSPTEALRPSPYIPGPCAAPFFLRLTLCGFRLTVMFDSSARQPCRYFQQGHCNRGTACKFSHSPRKQGEDPPRSRPVLAPHPSAGYVQVQIVSAQATATAPPACQYYLQGSCQFGDGCHYLHPRRNPRAPIITPSSPSGLRPLAPTFTPAIEKGFSSGSTGPGAFGSCKFYAQGKCSKGGACPFPHLAPTVRKQSVGNIALRPFKGVDLLTTGKALAHSTSVPTAINRILVPRL